MHVRVILPRLDRPLRGQVPFRPARRAHILHVIFKRALTARRTHGREVVPCGLEIRAQRGHEAEEGFRAGDRGRVGGQAFPVRGGG